MKPRSTRPACDAARRHRVAILALAAFAATLSCRTAPRSVIDPALGSCVPPDTLLLAGLNLDQLRASPFYSNLPATVLELAAPLRDASYLLVASNGSDYLIVARGTFRAAPAGTTLIDPSLVVSGPPNSLRAAIAQHKTKKPGAPVLLGYAEAIAAGKQIWIAADGRATLPVTGNAGNLNRLLHFTDHLSATARLSSGAELEVIATGRTPDSARQFEETLRAALSLAAVSSAGQPELATLLNSAPLRRDDRTVRVTLSASPAAAQQLFRLF